MIERDGRDLDTGGMSDLEGLQIDTLYDYAGFLRQGPIAETGTVAGGDVAVVGAGIGGLCAGFELLKAGANPVIFEAQDRIGGRNRTDRFHDGDGAPASAFADMGAMRFPASASAFRHYANDLFALDMANVFPDPGLVPTLLSYRGNAYSWTNRDPANPPGPFGRIARDWEAFISPIVADAVACRRRGDAEGLIRAWQHCLECYAHDSLYSAIARGMPHWTSEDLGIFGSLGIGAGGYGALYHTGFVEFLRIIVNDYHRNQTSLLGGADALNRAFADTLVDTPLGRRSLSGSGAINRRHRVIGIGPDNADRLVLAIEPPDGNVIYRSFKAVIIATTTRAMQLLLMTGGVGGYDTYFNGSKYFALQNLNMIESSKMFIRTEQKFWKIHHNIPHNIQSDAMSRGVYCIDNPGTENGVVLLSYAWGADSVKMQSFDPMRRFEMVRGYIDRISPQFAEHLVPVNGEIKAVDWQSESDHMGAFKLMLPGQDVDNAGLYFQFQKAGTAHDDGIYLAGDGISWSGGWAEGALHTGINAACAAIRRLGGRLRPGSPMEQCRIFDYR